VGELRFEGRTVLVTGAGRGIGRSHALLLAKRGANVVVADLGGELDGTGSSTDPAEQVVAEITAQDGSAVPCCASVATPEGAHAMADTAVKAFGGIDAVINNAGISRPDRFDELDVDRFRSMIDVHYLGTINVIKAAWPQMASKGYGRIVNTCSEAAFGMVPKNTSYGGAKGGVFGLTRSLALDARRHGILVNAVAPRANTRLSAPEVLSHTFDVPAESFGDVMDRMQPDLVSPAAVFLAHEACELNGEVLVAGGGQVFRLAVVTTEGITRSSLTPEDVAANLPTIMDTTGASVLAAEVRMELE
jgi:NAD(P)-dependent dehydrogenase (short-subunit alcohol dehydrogenase family)